MKRLIELRCPSCGAALEIEKDREFCFCNYCGTKILIKDDSQFTYRHIDDAEIKRAETERAVKLKNMEMEEKRRRFEKAKFIIKITISVILAVFAAAVLFYIVSKLNATDDPDSPYYLLMPIPIFAVLPIVLIWTLSADSDDDKNGKNKKSRILKLPDGVFGYQFKNYATIESLFRDAGYEKIRCVPLKDLQFSESDKAGLVASITVGGQPVVFSWDKFYSDATVVIAYHSVVK